MTHRTWFITGASSGIGLELTKQLLARGSTVAATARNLSALKELRARYQSLLWTASLDVTDTPAIRKVVNAAFADLSKIDVVVNSAGYGLFGAAEEVTDEQIIHQINTNLVGSIQVVRAALPHLRRQGGGRIIQISSGAGQVAFPGGALYNASKWGIEGFSEAIMMEVAPFNISVTIVEPGNTRTDFKDNSKFGPQIDAYALSPANWVRDVSSAPPASGNPAKMAAVIIDSLEQQHAPSRLALGSDVYGFVHGALSQRLATLEAQKELAFTTDFAPSA